MAKRNVLLVAAVAAVRVPARTIRLRVRVGRRDVSARFRSSGRSLRIADLGSSDGPRYGTTSSLSLPSGAAVDP